MAGLVGCKGSLLKVREGNTKGSMVGPRSNLEARRLFLHFRSFLNLP
jgi:hypothetical protein